MRNLKAYPFTGTCLPVYEAAVKKKHAKTASQQALKTKLESLTPDIGRCYTNYETNFSSNTLELLTPASSCQPGKTELLSLYGYLTKTVRGIKKGIYDAQDFTTSDTCQNCTVDSVGSMDHILAKTTFPEYAVHPLNLFPCCTKCNSYKSTLFEKGDTRKFLNLYLDRLPDEQYLFVRFTRDAKGELDFAFTLENKHGIDPVVFALIVSHFEGLQLLTRMKIKSVDYIEEIKTDVSIRRGNLPLDTVRDEIIRGARRDMLRYGNNYYHCVLKIACMESDDFLAPYR